MRVTVYHDASVVVTAPRSTKRSSLEDFVSRQSKWILSKVQYFKKHPRVVIPKSTKAEYIKHKAAAQMLVESRIAYFNQVYNFRFNNVSIKNQKTRWGSCSKKGNLNFNYRIALIPADLADYVVVHELCHLRHMNHSKKFWDLVAETTPDWKQRRKELLKFRF